MIHIQLHQQRGGHLICYHVHKNFIFLLFTGTLCAVDCLLLHQGGYVLGCIRLFICLSVSFPDYIKTHEIIFMDLCCVGRA